MPTLEIEGIATVEVEAGKRLVLAIEDAGVDIMHACGGNARCTTCRVEFLEGEPERMTVAERDKLVERQLTGVRLSCQMQWSGRHESEGGSAAFGDRSARPGSDSG